MEPLDPEAPKAAEEPKPTEEPKDVPKIPAPRSEIQKHEDLHRMRRSAKKGKNDDRHRV